MYLVLQGKDLQLGEDLILLFCGFLSHVTNSSLHMYIFLCTFLYVCILMFLAFKDSLHLKIEGVMGVYSVLSELW